MRGLLSYRYPQSGGYHRDGYSESGGGSGGGGGGGYGGYQRGGGDWRGGGRPHHNKHGNYGPPHQGGFGPPAHYPNGPMGGPPMYGGHPSGPGLYPQYRGDWGPPRSGLDRESGGPPDGGSNGATNWGAERSNERDPRAASRPSDSRSSSNNPVSEPQQRGYAAPPATQPPPAV